MIQVRFFGGLAAWGPVGKGDHELTWPTESASGREILASMGIPEGKIGIVMVNGRVADLDVAIHDGDRVAFFTPVGGG